MKAIALMVAALALAGCKPSITLQAEEWHCTQRGDVPDSTIVRPGIVIEGTRIGCTQWTRF